MLKASTVKLLEANNDMPKFKAIALMLREEILADKYKPGEHLPTNRQLVKMLNSSQATVSKAMSLLLDEGLILRTPKIGTVVAPITHRKTRIRTHQICLVGINDISKAENPLNWFVSEQLLRGILNQNTRHIIKMAETFEEGRLLLQGSEPEAFVLLYFSPEDLKEFRSSDSSPYISFSSRTSDFSEFNAVNYDAMNSCFNAVKLLIKQGHKKIAMIWGGRSFHRDTIAGYQAALKAFGLSSSEKNIINTEGGGEEAGAAAMEQLLKNDRTISAVFADTDFKAIGAIKYCREHGIRIPEDISIMGCDDIPVLAAQYQLTTVHKPFVEIGHAIIDMLDERLTLNKQDLPSRLFTGRIKERKSCAPPRHV
jgi:DNA-binding LacI/PurR family transcriptional regulator